MIDIEKAKRFYKEYISRYNPEESRIALKIAHIYRTAQKAKWLAEELKLSQEDVLLAELIGLLHDIGRFEQLKQYNTFLDKDSINHGEYGVKILFEEGLIRNFVEDNQYDEIIRKAILNHNKDRIQDGCSQRELTHCKIIRDADKLDIYYVILTDSLEVAYPLEKYPKEGISKEIKEEFILNHKINYADIKSCIDILVGQIAYVFDINYLYTLEEIKKKEYLNQLTIKFDAQMEQTVKELEELKNLANKYMQEKIEEGKICLKNY